MRPLAATTTALGSAAPPGEVEPRAPVLTGVALTVFTLTPLVAYVGNLAFAPVLALAGLVCLPLALRRAHASLGAGLLFALLAWALASLAWSPAAPTALRTAKEIMAFTGLKLVFELALYGAFVAALSRLPAAAARTGLTILGVGLAASAVLLLLEAGRGAELYQTIKAAVHSHTRPDLARRNVARATYAIALLIWPAALALSARGWAYVAVIAGLGAAVDSVALNVDAPVAALAAGSLAWGVVRFGGRGGTWLVLTGVLAYFALAPVAVLLIGHALPAHGGVADIGKSSWHARLDIWRFVADRIVERPIQGWGLDASRVWPGIVPLHPHDGALQLWLELGAPGALLAALFFGWLFSRLAAWRERDPVLAATGAASTVAYLVIGALSFGIWQEWWLALGALAWGAWFAAARMRGDLVIRTDGELVPIEEAAPHAASPLAAAAL